MIIDSVLDRNKWNNILLKNFYNEYDINFHPDYVSMHCKENISSGKMFCYFLNEKIWVHIFLMIKTPNYLNSHVHYDLETPYGYGGPLSNTNDKVFIINANKEFYNWAKSQSVVVQLIRFHPIINNKELFLRNEVHLSKETFALNLNDFKDLSFFKQKQRNLIKSSSTKLKIFFDRSISSFEEFKNVYLIFMKIKKAKKELFFSEKYFETLFNLIQSNGFVAKVFNHQNKNICYGLFTFGTKIAHYHLSASQPKIYIPGSINFMIYKSAIFLKKLKKDILHLGGGTTEAKNDSLRNFKSSMSNKIYQYTIGKVIFDENFYNLNKQAWAKKNPSLKDKFFNHIMCYHYKK